MNIVKQSTAVILKLGPFLDDTDGVTPETGLSIGQADIQISKTGGAFAQTSEGTPATTHDADGWYPIPLTTTDTETAGELVVQVAMSGALPVWWRGFVAPANVYDSLVGSDKLQVDAVEISSDSTAADNLEAACDGNTYNIGGGAVVAASVTSGVTLADGAHGGSSASLALGAGASISNASGSALTLSSTGGNGHGLVATGNGTGEGISATGGATGHGLELTGGSSNGSGLKVTGKGDHAGALIIGNGDGAGVQVTAGATGPGLYVSGGATSGNAATLITPGAGPYGLWVSGGTNGAGARIIGQGSGVGLDIAGGATGAGIRALGGATSGPGIIAQAQNNNDAGMELVAHGTGLGLDADNVAALATGASLATVDANVDAILADTGTDGVVVASHTTAAKAEINAEVDAALNTAIPGSPTADSINERVKTMDDAYTAARAAYLDELAAANVPADIDTLIARLTAARAGYLDELGAANIPADVDSLLARLTAARAGYLDELAAANLPADVDTIKAFGAPPSAATIKTTIEAAGSHLAEILTDTGTTLPGTLTTISGKVDAVDTVVDSILADTGTDGVVLSTATMNSIAAALLDLSNGIETGYTLRQVLRIIAAAVAGKLSGAATTTNTIRDITDTKARITATVDSDGNRTAITLDGT